MSGGITGSATPSNGTSQYNSDVFTMLQLINKICTIKVVQVKAYTPGAGLLPGTVDVQPAVNQVDGLGNATPHGTINGLPVWMLQGGSSAAIIPPAVGDLGICVFSDRDISSVKSAKKIANPGSFRTFDAADGIYLGGILNAAPTQYIQFLAGAAGINIVTPGPLKITASTVTHNGVDIGAAHRHPYQPGTGATTDTGTPV